MRTCQDGAPFALLLHSALPLSSLGEGHLEHEAPDVVASLKLRSPLLQLLLVKERGHVGHLDVSKLGIQVLWVNLENNKQHQSQALFLV